MTANKARPAISIRVGNCDPGVSMIVEATNIDDEPIIKIVNKKKGTVNTLPYADRDIFDNDSFRFVDYEIEEKREDYHWGLYHPTSYVKDLVSSPGINDYTTSHFNSDLKTLVRSQDEGKTPSQSNYEKWIPYLVWHTGYTSEWGDSQYRAEQEERQNSKVRIRVGQNGWALYLTGLERLPIAFAEWDDEGKIIKLANSLYDVEVLKKKALKIYPEKASELMLYDTVQDTINKCERYDWRGGDQRAIEYVAKVSPELQSRFLHKLYRNDNRYELGVAGRIDPVVLDKHNVAFRVSTPYSSLVKRDVYPNTFSGFRASFLAKRREARELKGKSSEERNIILDLRAKEAVRRYSEEYKKVMNDARWQVIEDSTEENFSPSWHPYYWLPRDFQARGWRSSFWVTKLSAEEWKNIASFCSEANVEREHEHFIF